MHLFRRAGVIGKSAHARLILASSLSRKTQRIAYLIDGSCRRHHSVPQVIPVGLLIRVEGTMALVKLPRFKDRPTLTQIGCGNGSQDKQII